MYKYIVDGEWRIQDKENKVKVNLNCTLCTQKVLKGRSNKPYVTKSCIKDSGLY